MTTDITFCSTSEWCPLREKCERANHPKEWIHSYCTFCDDRCQKETWCDFYLPKEDRVWQHNQSM